MQALIEMEKKEKRAMRIKRRPARLSSAIKLKRTKKSGRLTASWMKKEELRCRGLCLMLKHAS